MSNRRSFLKLLGGSAVAAPLVTPKEAAAALGLDPSKVGVVGNGIGSATCGSPSPGLPVHRLISSIYREREVMTRSIEHMPAHIRTKKSWSDTFKASAWSAEDRVFQALVEKMERDEAFAGRVAKMMFGGAA